MEKSTFERQQGFSSGIESKLSGSYDMQQFDTLKQTIVYRTKKHETESGEVGLIFRGFSEIVREYGDGNGLYDILAKVPFFGGYAQRKVDDRNGNAIERVKLTMDQKISKLEHHLYEWMNDYSTAKRELVNLLDGKSEAVKLMEDGEKTAADYQGKLAALMQTHQTASPRDRLTSKGVQLENDILESSEGLRSTMADNQRHQDYLVHATAFVDAYFVYMDALGKSIHAVTSLYNNEKFNLKQLDGINTNLTQVMKGIQSFIGNTATYQQLAHLSNEFLARHAELSKVVVGMVEQTNLPFFDPQYLMRAKRSGLEAGQSLGRMMERSKAASDRIAYGGAGSSPSTDNRG